LRLLITLLVYTNFALQCKIKVTNGFIAIYVLITLPGHLSSSRYSVGFVMLDIIFYVQFYRSLFVILYFFFIPIVLCPSSIYSFDIYKLFVYLQINAINNFGNNTVQCFVGLYLFCCLFFFLLFFLDVQLLITPWYLQSLFYNLMLSFSSFSFCYCSLKDLSFWLPYWYPQFVRAMLSTINKGFITIYKLITCSYRLRCTFSFGHCVVCSSSIYGFWLPLWYLQTLLIIFFG
jgi:hypothetical protein